jgi:hypothetical protein
LSDLSAFAVCGVIRLMLGSAGVMVCLISSSVFVFSGSVLWLPAGIKLSMYLAGYLFDFPVTISTFFGEGTAIYNVVDIQSLICAALIFTMMFYYPLRMIINPGYARIFWRRSVKPMFFINSLFISLPG